MKSKLINFIAFFALLISSASMYANEKTMQWTPQSKELLQSLKNDVRETLSLIAETQGHTSDQFQYSLDLSEAHKVNLGLILELNDSQSAFVVISVTPGGLASAYGLGVDDEIESVDGIDVSATTENEILRRLQHLRMGHKLFLSVSHQGDHREIVIPLSATFVPRVRLEIGYGLAKQHSPTPAAELDSTACGEVAILLSPSENGELHPASFNKNDDNPGTGNQVSYKLSVGQHIVYVYEHIDDDSLVQSRGKEQKAKAIQINVRANTSYHLGAKPITGQYTETPNGEYWEAVIWKTSQRECQL